jgi:hypothetical protein
VTGLIYLVIIALWAAVLIPMWLRRHDQISEVRSTARFSSAMRSLGSQGQPQYAMSLGSMNSAPTEVLMVRPTTSSRPTLSAVDGQREQARQSAATRRAIVLGVLTALLLAALVASVLGVTPKWLAALAAVPVIAFIAASVMTASDRSSAPARTQTQRRTAPSRAQRAQAEAQAEPAQDEAEWENWNAWDDDDQSWEAVPTTLPTYVDAPRASAVPRGIDRDTPGEWTGSAMVETAQAMRARRRNEPLADASSIDHGAETTEIPVVSDDYQSRIAVNE